MIGFDTFKDEWLTSPPKRVADPTLVSDGLPSSQWYQCVSLIKQYLRECYGIETGYWGNAINYWTSTSSILLEKFDRLAITDVRKGSIVILRGLPGNAAGHIMIGTGSEDASMFEGMEQNGSTGGGTGTGGDAIRTRSVAKDRIAGVLQPKVLSVPVISHPYTIVAITQKQVILNKDAHKWNLSYDNFAAINGNPIDSVTKGDIKTVIGICHHNIGYDYYLEDLNVASGYNVLDCDDYIAPPVQPVLPAAPMIIPTSLDPYLVVRDIPGYLTSTQAAIRATPSNTTVPRSTYMIYDRKNSMINVTLTPGKSGWWINPADNVLQPIQVDSGFIGPRESTVPIPVVSIPLTWKQTKIYDKPEHYVGVSHEPYMVKDLEGKASNKPVALKAGQNIQIAGEFTKDGIVYGRPLAAMYNKQGQYIAKWYGVPLKHSDSTPVAPPIIELHSDVYKTELPFTEKRSLNIVHIGDYIQLAFEHIREFFSEVRGK